VIWILVALDAPGVLLGWLWVGLMMAIGAAKAPKLEEQLILTAEWRPWVRKIWRYSTTLGRGIVYQPHHRTRPRIPAHERVHVRQGADDSVRALVIGAILTAATLEPVFMLLWPTGQLWRATNFLTAWLRGFDLYRGAEHERSAYGQTDLGPDGSSWLERQLEAERQRRANARTLKRNTAPD
jgi:hypothetical protein